MIVATGSLVADLLQRFPGAVETDVSMSRFTSARIGGPADLVVRADSGVQLSKVINYLQDRKIPFVVLGGGSNVLVSDKGIRQAVVLNRAKNVTFEAGDHPTVSAESGCGLGQLAQQCALRGLSGLEWCATVPGTVGGAVYGNAGAFGGDIAGNLLSADILLQSGTRQFSGRDLSFAYRTSKLKTHEIEGVVLSAKFSAQNSQPQDIAKTMAGFAERRKATQPPGASMGSMFKNPQGDKAGRLIEAAGLKGIRVGDAMISPIHANFFVNVGRATSADIRQLIHQVQDHVLRTSGVQLELEIEFLGEE